LNRTTISLLVLSVMLGACNSSGGSRPDQPAPGIPTTPTTPPPVVIPPPATPPTTAPANISQLLQLNGGVSTGLAVSASVNTINVGTPSLAEQVVDIKFAELAKVTVPASGTITSITLDAPYASLSGSTNTWNTDSRINPGDIEFCQSCPNTGIYLENGTLQTATATVPLFQYMAFGTWYEDGAQAGTTIPSVGGFMVVGQPTDPANIPTTGTATYLGAAGGIFIDTAAGAGQPGDYVAAFSANADFAARTLAVSTANMTVNGVAMPQHNITGTLSYGAGSNSFTGNIATPSGITGTATGAFFGPTAQEIGGVTKMQGGTVQAIGIFGGKR
jgi:hypothetical protein